ncbi:MAG: hypothetical protein COV44_08330 [Deltaproteobacteria bacterium CG11_big_fil_rev_8_21_14_0_20_45_16]|nr:MAG: hypothetical protein COV44_08330 [Deltaproteobacteria bacterium CG11_big_fil_rev_8_21_14_0_20_45_16]
MRRGDFAGCRWERSFFSTLVLSLLAFSFLSEDVALAQSFVPGRQDLNSTHLGSCMDVPPEVERELSDLSRPSFKRPNSQVEPTGPGPTIKGHVGMWINRGIAPIHQSDPDKAPLPFGKVELSIPISASDLFNWTGETRWDGSYLINLPRNLQFDRGLLMTDFHSEFLSVRNAKDGTGTFKRCDQNGLNCYNTHEESSWISRLD